MTPATGSSGEFGNERGIFLRGAVGSDASQIWEVRTQAIRSGCRNHYTAQQIESWSSAPMPSRFEAFISQQRFVVAESGGQIVGFAGVKVASREIDALFVSPHFAGHGLGARLLAQAEKVAQDLGIAAVTLKASLNSVAFYRKAGYSAGATGTPTTASGVSIACVHMEKVLSC